MFIRDDGDSALERTAESQDGKERPLETGGTNFWGEPSSEGGSTWTTRTRQLTSEADDSGLAGGPPAAQ
jgi:hypothetical protein